MSRDRVVSIDYTIRLTSGEVIETSSQEGPITYLHGRAQIVPGVERAIDGLQPGDELVVEVGPADGYGDRDPESVFLVPRSVFPDDEEVGAGMTFSALRPDGRPVLFRVLRVDPDVVLVDANHPLAGKSLQVWVAVREVRDATLEERADGRIRADAWLHVN